MKQDVQVSVLGIQNAGEEPEAILTRATGIYCFENGVHKIIYCELDEDGNATENFLFLSQAEMRLSKSGSIAGQFLFIQNRETVTEYLTPFGNIVFWVKTESYSIDVKEDHLNVQLKYKLYTGNQLFSENVLNIQIHNSSLDGMDSTNMTRRNYI